MTLHSRLGPPRYLLVAILIGAWLTIFFQVLLSWGSMFEIAKGLQAIASDHRQGIDITNKIGLTHIDVSRLNHDVAVELRNSNIILLGLSLLGLFAALSLSRQWRYWQWWVIATSQLYLIFCYSSVSLTQVSIYQAYKLKYRIAIETHHLTSFSVDAIVLPITFALISLFVFSRLFIAKWDQ